MKILFEVEIEDGTRKLASPTTYRGLARTMGAAIKITLKLAARDAIDRPIVRSATLIGSLAFQ